MERVEDYKKKPTKKSLYYRKRCYGMTSLDRISVEKKRQQLDIGYGNKSQTYHR
jgi:hypothetical protein